MLILEILLSVVVAFVFMSFIEYLYHRYLMHRRFLPEFLYRMVPAFERLYQEHTLGHHVRYHERFQTAEDPQEYEGNLEIRLRNAVIGTVIALPLLIPFAIYLSPIFPITLVVMLFLGRLVWNKVHREMHHPKHPKWSRSEFFRFLARHHLIHHRRSDGHFNVIIPLGDYVTRRTVSATVKEREEMAALGLLP